jgi:hypothetical protein
MSLSGIGGALMVRQFAAGMLTVLFLGIGNSFAEDTAAPDDVRVGDRWSYDVKDDATGDLRRVVTFVVIEITDKEITTRVTERGKDQPHTVVFNREWGRMDNGIWQTRPSGYAIKKPLEVNKEWRNEASARNLKTGVSLRVSAAAKVAAQEKITTVAGEFDTFRIEAKVRQVNTRDQTKSSTITETTWYAPAINRWVKRKTETRAEGRIRDSVSEELTEYTRKP